MPFLYYLSEGRKIITTDDGEIILLGWINKGQGLGGLLGKIVVIKIDNDGNLLWEKIYSLAPNTDCRDICKMDDGGFVLVGELGFDDVGDPELFLSKIDSEGVLQWKKDYLYTMYTKGEHHINVDTRNLLSGFYQVVIRTEMGHVAKGFIRN